MSRVSHEWMEKMRIKIESTGKVDETSGYNPATKWLICRLSEKKLPFKIINLGAGVKRITTDTEICEKCNGTGKC